MTPARLSIPAVCRSAFANVRGRVGDVIALQVACLAPSWAAMTLYQLSRMLTDLDPDLAPFVGLVTAPLSLLWTATAAVCGAHATVAPIQSALANRANRPRSFGDVYGAAIRGTPRMLGLMVLWMVFLVLGGLACLAPGIWVLALWTLTAPVLVEERLGAFRALERAHALSKGSRLALVGLGLTWAVPWIALLVGLDATPGAERSSPLPVLATLWMRVPVDVLTNVLLAEVGVAAYLALVEPEKTVDAQGLADVFA